MKRACFLLILSVTALAADDKTDRATLKGLKAVCVVVEVSDQSQGSGSGINQDKLQSEIRGRLQQAGIPLDKDSTTCLYLNIRPLPAIGKNNRPIGLYAVDLKLEFLQAVTLARDSAVRAYATTWSVANLANVPADDVERTSREIAMDLVGRFVRAYQAVNR